MICVRVCVQMLNNPDMMQQMMQQPMVSTHTHTHMRPQLHMCAQIHVRAS